MPMLYLPLTATPLGWVVLGASGYLLYKAGKKKGQEEAAASRIIEPPAELPKETTETSTKGGNS